MARGIPIPYSWIDGLPPEAQRQIERDFLAVLEQISPSVTSFDAIIDPALPTSLPSDHKYKNLSDLAVNETWTSTQTLNVGVVARADHTITEPSAPDLSTRGHLTLVGIGAAGGNVGTTPQWSWVAPTLHSTQHLLVRGIHFTTTAGVSLWLSVGGEVDAFDCAFDVSGSLAQTFFIGYNCLINTNAIVNGAGGTATLYNCDWNASGTLFTGQTLHMIGGRVNPGGGGTITFAGSGEIAASFFVGLTINSVTTGTITVNNLSGEANALTIDGAGPRVVEGTWGNVTILGPVTDALRTFNGVIEGVLDVTGPAKIDAGIEHTSGGGAQVFRGTGIHADLRINRPGVPTVSLIGCTDSIIIASLPVPTSIGWQASAIDVASARCIVILSGVSEANYTVASTNAGTNCLVITELFAPGGSTTINNSIFQGAGILGQDGQDGDDGYPGPPGPIGATGAAGRSIQGPTGDPGEDGLDGMPGPQGATGTQGPQGAAGFGAPGTAGVDGEDGLDGLPGPQGAVGAQGLQGAAIRGMAGEDGEDGYDGLPGAQGAVGPQGLQGATIRGQAGEDGEDGLDGMPGPPGATGPQGPQGIPGTGGSGSGQQGAPGLDGEDGEPGPPGPPGPSIDRTAATRSWMRYWHS